MRYLNKFFQTWATPQSMPIPGTAPNNAGGHAFLVDDWRRLERFLLLGSENGTYYVGEHPLTRENAQAVARCIADDGREVVRRVTEISQKGRAPKNDPALFVLAMAAGAEAEEVRKAALDALPLVARTGAHLLHFAALVEKFRGWGRGLRKAVAGWYNSRPVESLAYQVVKYRQRDGWSHRDLLRLAHPLVAADQVARRALYHWILWREEKADAPRLLEGFHMLDEAQADVIASAEIIREYGLPREATPTALLREPLIWDALLERMPLMAMLRNLGVMGSVGLITPESAASQRIIAALGDREALMSARIHPLAALVALKTYGQGRGLRGKLTWRPDREVVRALDAAFYLAFQNIQPTNRRILLALDVSGSMDWHTIAGMPLTAREAAAAMALVTQRVERQVRITAFQGRMTPLDLSRAHRVDQVVDMTSGLPFGATDCAQPMLYALKRREPVDAFVVYTDSETWAGSIHPVEALNRYRERMGIDAKLAVVGMTSNGFSIADPNDAGMLDVVGFDTAAPAIIADFIQGRD